MPIPVFYEEISPTSSAVMPLTLATINDLIAKQGGGDLSIELTCATYPVAYRYDGVDPTTSTVQQLSVGDRLNLHGITALRNFKAIGVGGTAVLGVTYWGK